MFSILYGLLSAATWGASDFYGGLASQRAPSYQVAAVQWTAGLIIIPVVALISGEQLMPWSGWLWCGAAGGIGVWGILILYKALASGKMSLTASVSAVSAAALPVLVGSLIEGLPGLATATGFILALAAIWLISQTQDDQSNKQPGLGELKLPLIAGMAFGSYFILMYQGSQDGLFWPMVASRSMGVLVLGVFMAARRHPWLPSRGAYPLIGLTFSLDVASTIFFILAVQAGRMDVVAVITSLYPGMTILLAWLVLREKITRVQWIGIGLALAAIVLFSV